MNFELRNVAFSYTSRPSGKKRAAGPLSLAIGSGDCVGVIGHEGAGKTTLSQLLVGLLKPDEGTVLINGTDIWKHSRTVPELRKRIGFAFQFPEQQFFCENVRDELLYATRNAPVPGECINPGDALKMVGLSPDEYLSRSPYALSMGEARRVALALLFMTGPEALLLDEPTVGLDGAGVDMVLDLLHRAHSSGRTVVTVSHDLDVLTEIAQRIVVMEGGRVEVDGSASSVLTNGHLLEKHGYELPEGVRVVRARKKKGPADGGAECDAARELLQSIRKKSFHQASTIENDT